MEKQYIVKELENVSERLRKEADTIIRISMELEKGTLYDKMNAGIVRAKGESLNGMVMQIGTISQLIKLER